MAEIGKAKHVGGSHEGMGHDDRVCTVAASRRLALNQTTMIGTAPPTAIAINVTKLAAPAAAKTIPAKSPEPAAA